MADLTGELRACREMLDFYATCFKILADQEQHFRGETSRLVEWNERAIWMERTVAAIDGVLKQGTVST
jgi:N-acetylglucosamine kinase-like BadF-type ATPase